MIKIFQRLKSIWSKLFVSDKKIPKQFGNEGASGNSIDQKVLEKLVEKSLKALEERCADFFVSKYKETFVCFDIPNSEYMALIKVMKDYAEIKNWRVAVGVMKEGTDKIVEICSMAMYDDEVIEYLRKPETKSEIFTQIIELNEKAPDSLGYY